MARREVHHQQVFMPNSFGGFTNTTVCGRVDNSKDDLNVDAPEVTCKFCQRIIAEGRSPRLKYIGWQPA